MPDKGCAHRVKNTRPEAFVDGIEGRIGLTGENMANLIGLTLYMLGQGAWSLRLLQIVGGHWTQALQFRKCASCYLSWYWQALETAMTRGWAWSNAEVRRELLSCISLLPLMNFDLRCGTSDTLVATDASEHGGGACAATRVTKDGMLMGAKLLKEEKNPMGIGVALIDLGSGIAATRQALHLLGCNISVFASREIDAACKRLIKHHWP